jgi:CDP-6-deoxy-D-xylo-4-hexulose-3-dehydrase
MSSIVKPCKKVITKDWQSGQPNGFLVEIVSAKDGWTEFLKGQVYMTTVPSGVFKGFHIHKKKIDHFTCVKGNIFVVTYDRGKYYEYPSGVDHFCTVKVPPGIPHGLYNYRNGKETITRVSSRSNRKMKSRKEIRKKIRQLIKEFFSQDFLSDEFIPGKTLIQYAGSIHDDKEIVSMIDSLLDGWWGLGKKAREFESKLAQYIGVEKAILTNSGSSASLLVIASLKSPLFPARIKEGAEIITPACTFPTSLNPVIQLNLVPVFVDVELETYNLNPNKLRAALSSKTRAIVLPHTLGNPNDMAAITSFAKKHHLFVIEDNCDGLGSEFDGQKTGSFGIMSTLSFYPAHHITTGEGGAVLINDIRLERPLRSLRDWGRACYCYGDEKSPLGACGRRFDFKVNGVPYDHRYMYTEIGYNLKPIEVQAAMGLEQLKKLPQFKKRRKKNFSILFKFLSQYRDFIILPRSHPKADACWFSFPITLRENAPFSRQEIVRFLEGRKIQTRPVFAGNILRHEPYKNIKCRVVGELKNSDYILANTFFVGIYPGIDEQRLDYMMSSLADFFGKWQ